MLFKPKPKKPTPAEIADARSREIAREVFAEELAKAGEAIVLAIGSQKNGYFRLMRLVQTGSTRLYNEKSEPKV